MDLIKCPNCGEEYSSSYSRCPFCEEESGGSGKLSRTPKRHIANANKAQSARGALIVVLILVLALLSWYLFGDRLFKSDAPDTQTGSAQSPGPSDVEKAGQSPEDQAEVVPAGPSDASEQASGPSTAPVENGAGEQSPAVDPAPAVNETPVEDANVDVSGASLNRSDFTLSKVGEQFQLKVSGTTATPHWSIDNANVATLNANGTVTAVANGTTTVRCRVGKRELTCIVRVTNTGRSAAAAGAPTAAEAAKPSAPEVPAQPSAPEESASSSVNASKLRVKTNVGGVLPTSGGKYDCTVNVGGDKIRLIAVDEDGKTAAVTWSSANEDVVSVGSDGSLTPKKAGTADVIGSAGGGKVTCIIRVK